MGQEIAMPFRYCHCGSWYGDSLQSHGGALAVAWAHDATDVALSLAPRSDLRVPGRGPNGRAKSVWHVEVTLTGLAHLVLLVFLEATAELRGGLRRRAR